MLERDHYHEDPIYKYMPDFSLEKYQEYIVTMVKPFRKLIFNQQQGQRWASRVNTANNIVTVIFTLGLIPVIFYKKMPVLKRYTSIKARVFWTIAILFIPTNIVNYYLASKVQQQVMQSYALNQIDFMRYKQTGDVTIMNPSVRFAQF